MDSSQISMAVKTNNRDDKDFEDWTRRGRKKWEVGQAKKINYLIYISSLEALGRYRGKRASLKENDLAPSLTVPVYGRAATNKHLENPDKKKSLTREREKKSAIYIANQEYASPREEHGAPLRYRRKCCGAGTADTTETAVASGARRLRKC